MTQRSWTRFAACASTRIERPTSLATGAGRTTFAALTASEPSTPGRKGISNETADITTASRGSGGRNDPVENTGLEDRVEIKR